MKQSGLVVSKPIVITGASKRRPRRDRRFNRQGWSV
jgi:hypothetical protein